MTLRNWRINWHIFRELEGHYDLYLRLKAGLVDSDRSNPKFIESLFSKIAEMLNSVDTQEAVTLFIPVFYQGVIMHYK